jgi:Fe-S-cluster containining protein
VSFVRIERLRARGSEAGRACGACTACCTVMAVTELRKPSRRACEHVGRDGCRAHDARPESCRAFFCAWMRGAMAADEALRPDALGVMVDWFTTRATGESHLLAFEVWPGAFDSAEARAVLAELARAQELRLSHRDGSWSVFASDDG